MTKKALMVVVLGLLCGCMATTGTIEESEIGPFVPSPDDETLESTDPPVSPDADDAPVVLDEAGTTMTTKGAGPKCPPASSVLSPTGLTFVLHVSKHPEHAAREVRHLQDLRRYLRARDVFMVERGSPYVAKLRESFPCNRIHFIAYPDEMHDALTTGEGIDGIAVDWEGGAVMSHSASWSAGQLHDYTQKIHERHKTAGFVPAWSGAFDDAAITKASKMDYELPQIQGACVSGPAHFASAAKRILHGFHARGLSARTVGFEISLDSFSFAANHVGAARAADCTRAAYGKGVRAIYIYGNGHDHLPDYFHALGKMGVRTPK